VLGFGKFRDSGGVCENVAGRQRPRKFFVAEIFGT